MKRAPALDEMTFGGRAYTMDLKSERFVHFTTRANAEKILRDGALVPPCDGCSVFAVSTTYGTSLPGVQTTHIGGDVVALVFRTNVAPERGYVEEVTWRERVPLFAAKVMSEAEGRALLDQAPSRLGGDQDVVFYDLKAKLLR